MKRTYYLIAGLFLLLCGMQVQAQEQTQAQTQTKKGFDLSKLELGGNFGFSFGSSDWSGTSTAFRISPLVGYRFSQKFSAGGGPSYTYRKYSKLDYTENYGGLNFYARFRPVRYLILQAQPEFYRTWGKNFDERFVTSLLLGAGGIIPVGNSSGVSVTLSYDVIQDDYSPYRDQLVYSIGYVFSF